MAEGLKKQACEKEMLADTRDLYDRVCLSVSGKTPPETLPPSPFPWIVYPPAAVAAEKKNAGPKTSSAKPVVISFDAEGRPVTEQKLVEGCSSGGDVVVVVPVHAWHRSVAAQTLDIERWHQGAISSVMNMQHRAEATTNVRLQMQYSVHKEKFWVVAMDDLDVDSVALFPCAPTAKKFPSSTNHTAAVRVRVAEKRPEPDSQGTEYFILPDWHPPVCKAEATGEEEEVTVMEAGGDLVGGSVQNLAVAGKKGDTKGTEHTNVEGGASAGGTVQAPAVAGGNSDAKPTEGENVKGGAGAGETALADAGGIQVHHHFHFKGKESLHFFWGVDRLTDSELQAHRLHSRSAAWRFNVRLVDREFQVFTTGGQGNGVPTRIASVTVPAMTNFLPIKKGERLIMEKRSSNNEGAGKKREVAWQEAVRLEEGKRQKGPQLRRGQSKINVES